MATSPISSRASLEITQAVETIVTTCANTPAATLFRRSIELPDEQRIKRNVAFAILTNAGFESPADLVMGGFGGFATTACKQAILAIRTCYLDTTGGNDTIIDRRRDLYALIKQKLNAEFGKEHTKAIPFPLDVRQVKKTRKYLYYSGYSLNMNHMINGLLYPPKPFLSAITPIQQIQQNHLVQLPNSWINSQGGVHSTATKRILFNRVCDLVENRLARKHPPAVITTEEPELEYQCTCGIQDLIRLFFHRIPSWAGN
jgi:hypothetical protein